MQATQGQSLKTLPAAGQLNSPASTTCPHTQSLCSWAREALTPPGRAAPTAHSQRDLAQKQDPVQPRHKQTHKSFLTAEDWN